MGERVSHLRSLTSLRFFAAALVVMHHISVFAPGLGVIGLLTPSGYVGVTFFFVLSGFVLTYSWKPGGKAHGFYRRRFARVYPVHLLFLAIGMVPTVGNPYWPALPANLTLLQAWSPNEIVARSFSGVSWSLSCELFFYATFPLLVGNLMRVRHRLRLGASLFVIGFVVGIALEVRQPSLGLWLFHLPLFRLVEFVGGCLLASALANGWVPRIRVRWALGLVVVSYLVVLGVPGFIGYRLEDRWFLSLLMAPSFLALIAACARVDIVGAPSPLQSRGLVALGQWSFCIYMSHPVVLAVTRPLLGSQSFLGSVVGLTLVMLTVVGVSYLLYAAYERPLERLLRGSGSRASDSDDVRASSTHEQEPHPVSPPLASGEPVEA